MKAILLYFLLLSLPLMASAHKQAFPKTDQVSVHDLPERTVASHGARGGYSVSNFEEAAEALRAWLENDDQYEAVGEVRGIFLECPYVPWFLKRFEVHIPVRYVEK